MKYKLLLVIILITMSGCSGPTQYEDPYGENMTNPSDNIIYTQQKLSNSSYTYTFSFEHVEEDRPNYNRTIRHEDNYTRLETTRRKIDVFLTKNTTYKYDTETKESTSFERVTEDIPIDYAGIGIIQSQQLTEEERTLQKTGTKQFDSKKVTVYQTEIKSTSPLIDYIKITTYADREGALVYWQLKKVIEQENSENVVFKSMTTRITKINETTVNRPEWAK